MTSPDPISCEAAHALLDDYLDGELDADTIERIESHLPQCEACAREFLAEARLLAEVRARLRDVTMPEALLQRLEAILTRGTNPS